jgi:phage-related protein
VITWLQNWWTGTGEASGGAPSNPVTDAIEGVTQPLTDAIGDTVRGAGREVSDTLATIRAAFGAMLVLAFVVVLAPVILPFLLSVLLLLRRDAGKILASAYAFVLALVRAVAAPVIGLLSRIVGLFT